MSRVNIFLIKIEKKNSFIMNNLEKYFLFILVSFLSKIN